MLKMKNTQHFGYIVFYYFKKGKNTTETQKYRLVEKVLWLIEHVKSGLRFCAGDFFLDNAPWSGTPDDIDSDQIEALIKKNQP